MGGWRDLRAPSRLHLAARRSLTSNDLGDAAEQALRTATRSGLKLVLHDDDD